MISCAKNVRDGDVIHLSSSYDKYQVIGLYINAIHPDYYHYPAGFIPVLNMRNKCETVLLSPDFLKITKIIKAKCSLV